MTIMKIKIAKPNAVVFKIFGVTTTRQFIKTLDEYFDSHLNEYLENHWNELSDIINKITAESIDMNKKNRLIPKIETNSSEIEAIKSALKKYVEYVIKNKLENSFVDDLKHYIWGEGYEKKQIQVPLYEDVPKALINWKTNNIKRYSFSAGSSSGQEVIYQNSIFGDLRKDIDGYLTTKNTKMRKRDPITFTKLAEKMSEKTEQILFLTDKIEEAKASLTAGMKCLLVSRNNPEISIAKPNLKEFVIIQNFDEIEFK